MLVTKLMRDNSHLFKAPSLPDYVYEIDGRQYSVKGPLTAVMNIAKALFDGKDVQYSTSGMSRDQVEKFEAAIENERIRLESRARG